MIDKNEIERLRFNLKSYNYFPKSGRVIRKKRSNMLVGVHQLIKVSRKVYKRKNFHAYQLLSLDSKELRSSVRIGHTVRYTHNNNVQEKSKEAEEQFNPRRLFATSDLEKVVERRVQDYQSYTMVMN